MSNNLKKGKLNKKRHKWREVEKLLVYIAAALEIGITDLLQTSHQCLVAVSHRGKHTAVLAVNSLAKEPRNVEPERNRRHSGLMLLKY